MPERQEECFFLTQSLGLRHALPNLDRSLQWLCPEHKVFPACLDAMRWIVATHPRLPSFFPVAATHHPGDTQLRDSRAAVLSRGEIALPLSPIPLPLHRFAPIPAASPAGLGALLGRIGTPGKPQEA